MRLANARALAAEAGSQDRFGERLGMSKAQVSQIIGRRPIRQIGDDVADRIEAAFKRPHNWLDTCHDAPLVDVIERLDDNAKASLLPVARALIRSRIKAVK